MRIRESIKEITKREVIKSVVCNECKKTIADGKTDENKELIFLSSMRGISDEISDYCSIDCALSSIKSDYENGVEDLRGYKKYDLTEIKVTAGEFLLK